MAVAPCVLVVEDDADVRAAIATALEDAGYTAAAAADGGAALAYLRAHAAPRVILLDLMMPGLDGAAFATSLRADAALASIPIVTLSALSARDARSHAIDAVARVGKPGDLDEILSLVARYCGPPSR